MSETEDAARKTGEAAARTTQAAAQTQKAANHAREAAETTASAATTTARAAVVTKSAAERATELAADRTALAYERTYASWLRTGLVAMASGGGAPKLLQGFTPDWVAFLCGGLLLLFSAFAFLAGIWRQLAQVEAPAPQVSSLPSGILVAANLGLASVALLALAGMVSLRFG